MVFAQTPFAALAILQTLRRRRGSCSVSADLDASRTMLSPHPYSKVASYIDESKTGGSGGVRAIGYDA